MGLKIGIIGGSGLDNPKLLKNFREEGVITEYGKPSSRIICGNLGEAEVYILARHGKNHEISPSKVNYKANIFALKNKAGCDCILATTAVGSLREKIKPGNLAFPNQFIDFTKNRDSTFYDRTSEVVHTPMSEPFDKKMRDILCKTCDEIGLPYHSDVVVITIEGPRFSTKAESNLFRQFGADIINMSTCPEVILANELKIPYQSIAMVTDYDCWKKKEKPVTWEMILDRMNQNSEKVKKLLIKGIEKIVSEYR